MGHCTVALARLTLTSGLLLGLFFSISPAAAMEPQRFRLEAADGLSGAVRLPLTLDQPGRWRILARWSGRGLAGLWAEDGTTKKALRRVAGAASLELVLDVGDGAVAVGTAVTIRFNPTTDRGNLLGELEILPPSVTPQPPPPADTIPASPVQPSSDVEAPNWKGVGACLAPAAGKTDAAGRSLIALADALERADPAGQQWIRRWIGKIHQAAQTEERGKLSRGALDQLWDTLAANRLPDDPGVKAVRQVLAVVEDLTRRVLKNPTAVQAGEKRRRFLETISCVALPEDPAAAPVQP